MKTCSRRLLAKSAGLVFGAVTLLLGASQANATSTLNITYFTISPHDPSYNAMGLSTISDEVLGQLGPDGLPLYNPSNSLPNPISSADLHSTPAGQEITWWSPSLNSNVKQSRI